MKVHVTNIPTIIATVKPNFAGMIRSGHKPYEFRKSVPKCGLPFRVLVCESQSGGRITCSFIVDQVKEVRDSRLFGRDWFYRNVGITDTQADRYMNRKLGYLWHISHMVDFCNTRGCRVENVKDYGLQRAPQSWQYTNMSYGLTPQELEVACEACCS